MDATFIKALDVAAETLQESTDPWSARRADALDLMAESFLTSGATSSSTADRFQVVVHGDAETLRDDSPGRCTIPPAIRRALKFRDSGCRFPGCTHQRFLDAHPVKHWAHGGKTCVKNLVTLCRAHHRMVHEGGILMHTAAGIPIHSRTAATRWQGERMDYDLAVQGVIQSAKRASHVAAETRSR